MRYGRFLLIFLLSISLLTRCSKNQNNQSTRLRIDVADESGNVVSGATVRIYQSSNDPGITGITDDKGVVLFSNLSPEIYLFDAAKGCKNNRNDLSVLTSPLVPNAIIYIHTDLSENGVLQIINSSTDSFTASIKVLNRKFAVEVPGHDSTIIYPDTGPGTLHTENESAPGTSRDSLIQISCTDTTIIHLPY